MRRALFYSSIAVIFGCALWVLPLVSVFAGGVRSGPSYLPLAGGTLTGEVTADDLGIEFTPGDALTDCTTFAATGGGIFYDDSEGKFKKCEDNSLTDLDTSGGSPAFSTLTGGTNTAAAMVVGTGASLATSGSGTVVATSGDSATAFFSSGEIADAQIADTLTVDASSTVDSIATTNLVDKSATEVITGDWDFGGGGIEIENGTVPPACTVGQVYLDTDATSGQQLMACEGGSFVVQGDGGGAETNALETTITGILDTEIFIGNGANSGTFAAVSGDATLANTGALTVSDLTCTDCVNATEIEDIYVLNAGDTLTGELVADDLGLEFTAGDALTDCTTFAATGGGIFYDDSEGKFKKCEDNSLTDLDTTGGTPAFSSITGGTNTAAAMVVGTGASLGVSGSGTIGATDVACTGCVDATDIANDSIVDADINSAAAISMSKTALVAGTSLTLATNTLNVDDDFVSNAGDTLTGELVADDLGIEFTPGDTLTDCSTFAATGGGIFYDDSEGKFKKCQDNTLTDLDTGGAETNALETTVTGVLDTEIFIGNGADSGTFAAISGDATLANNGALAIAADVIDFADIKQDNTLAGNPALLVDECFNFATTTGGGFICEGSAANTNEQVYLFPDVDGADTTNRIVVNAVEVTDVTGNALTVTTGTLNLEIKDNAEDGVGTASSVSGLEFESAELTMLQGCADGQVLKWVESTDTWDCSADAGGGSGAFSDASDPVVLNTTGKDVVVGAAQKNTSKLTVDGDADQVQFTAQGHTTQTDSIVIIEDSGGTELFNVDADGTIKANTLTTISGSLTLGDAGIAAITLTTNGTGDAEVILPADSVGAGEVDTSTGSWDFGGASSFELPNSATPVTNVTGRIALDTTITDHQPLFQYYDGGEDMTIIAIDTAELPALNNEIIQYNATTDKFVLAAGGFSQDLMGGIEGATANSAYFPAVGLAPGQPSAEDRVETVMRRAGTLRNLYCDVETAPGGSSQWTFRVRINSANSGIACTVTGAATTCEDTVNTAAFSKGAIVNYLADETINGVSSSSFQCSVEVIP